jgi:uncharacterized membrane protein (DUF4010 family)
VPGTLPILALAQIDYSKTVLDFAIALFIGALIGLEREKKQTKGREPAIGGLRTFILIALSGAVSAWLSQELHALWIFAALGAMVTAAVLAGYVLQVRAHPEQLGMTTEVAAVVTFLLGGTVLFGHADIAVALAITTSVVLAYKQPLHGFVEKVGYDDLYAALKLLIATFIVLPVLPERTIDPWGAINPYELWVLVIAISGLSLIGYVVSRWLGEHRGIALTGIFGGLVSSTAVTLALARRSREKEASPAAAAALGTGLMLAWTIMFVRVVVEVAIVHPPLVARVAVSMAAMGAVALALALAGYRSMTAAAAAGGDELPLKNPFRMTSAIQFAGTFALVLLVVALAQEHLPGEGAYIVAAVAGVTDVDAITLSMAREAKFGRDTDVVVDAITIAAVTNTMSKCAFVALLGSAALRRRVIVSTIAILAAGAAAVLVG